MGSNVGIHTIHMAKRGTHVVAFEASPDTAELLQGSIDLNGLGGDDFGGVMGGSVRLIQAGVTNETTTTMTKMKLWRFANSPGFTTLARDAPFNLNSVMEEDNGDDGVEVRLVRARDELMKLNILPMNILRDEEEEELTLLKVDVEGYEYRALLGLNLTEYPFRRIIFEFFPTLIRSCGSDPLELLLYVRRMGYRYLNVIDGKDEDAIRIWYRDVVLGRNDDDGFHVNLFCERIY